MCHQGSESLVYWPVGGPLLSIPYQGFKPVNCCVNPHTRSYSNGYLVDINTIFGRDSVVVSQAVTEIVRREVIICVMISTGIS